MPSPVRVFLYDWHFCTPSLVFRYAVSVTLSEIITTQSYFSENFGMIGKSQFLFVTLSNFFWKSLTQNESSESRKPTYFSQSLSKYCCSASKSQRPWFLFRRTFSSFSFFRDRLTKTQGTSVYPNSSLATVTL